MLYRGMKLSVVGTGMLLATSAFAENHSPKVGFDYRAGLSYNDGNLTKAKGSDAKTSTDIALEFADLTVEGAAAGNVSYRIAYGMLESSLGTAAVDMKFSDMVTFSIGRDTALQGGWNYKDSCTTYAHVEGDAACAYAGPLNASVDYVGVNLAVAGTLRLNVMNDVKVEETTDAATDTEEGAELAASGTGNGYKNKSDKNQSLAIEWTGDFGGWKPLVQLLNYDLGKSMAFSVGVKGAVAGLDLMANYTSDSRKNYSVDPDGETDTYSMIDVHAGYAVAGFTPWVAFHKYDVKQGGTDLKVNAAFDSWEDNAQSISLGVNCTAISAAYVPYLTINNQSSTANDAEGKKKTQSGLLVKAGVMGKF